MELVLPIAKNEAWARRSVEIVIADGSRGSWRSKRVWKLYRRNRGTFVVRDCIIRSSVRSGCRASRMTAAILSMAVIDSGYSRETYVLFRL